MNVSLSSPTVKAVKEPLTSQSERESPSADSSEKPQFQGVFDKAMATQASENKGQKLTSSSEPIKDTGNTSTQPNPLSEDEEASPKGTPSGKVQSMTAQTNGEQPLTDAQLLSDEDSSESEEDTAPTQQKGTDLAPTNAEKTKPAKTVKSQSEAVTNRADSMPQQVRASQNIDASQLSDSDWVDDGITNSDRADKGQLSAPQAVHHAQNAEFATQADQQSPNDESLVHAQAALKASELPQAATPSENKSVAAAVNDNKTEYRANGLPITSEPTPVDVQQTMSDGQTLLQRLQQYQQTLTDKSGKGLPPGLEGEDTSLAAADVKAVFSAHDGLGDDQSGLANADFAEPMTKLSPAITASEDLIDWHDTLSDELPLTDGLSLIEQRPLPGDRPIDSDDINVDSDGISALAEASVTLLNPVTLSREDQQATDLTRLLTETTPTPHIPVLDAALDGALHQMAQSIAEGKALSPAQQQLLQTVIDSADVSTEQATFAEQLLSQTAAGQIVGQGAPLTETQSSVSASTSRGESALISSVPHTQVNQARSPQGMPQGMEPPLVNQSYLASQSDLASNSSDKLPLDLSGDKARVNGALPDSDRVALKRQRVSMMSDLSALSGGEQKPMSNAASMAHASTGQGLSTTPTPGMPPVRTDLMAMNMTRELAHDQLNEKVQMMMAKNLKSLDIRLDPPELGRLHIRMNLHTEGANVHFTVATPQAREMIEHTMPRLRDMLSSQGVSLGETSVQQEARQESNSGGMAQGNQGGHNELAADSTVATEDESAVNVSLPASASGVSFYA